MPEAIQSPDLAAPAAAYSHGVKAGSQIFVAGQIPVDRDGNIVGEGDIAEQTRQTIRNVASVLRAAEAGLDHIVSTTVYLTDMANFGEYDRVYGEYFRDFRPARATVQAELVNPKLLIEIQAIAVVPA
jgi:2-iminobutanoate/2-iminopropanoate deaminase